MTPTRRSMITVLLAVLLLPVAAPAALGAPAGYGLTGDNYAFVTAVDPAGHRVTVNRIAWYTGAAATRACRQDGVRISDVEWCHDYYYRDRSSRLRTLDVDPEAPISVVAPDGSARHATLAELPTATDRPYRLTVTRGRITGIDQIYLP